MDTKNKKSDKDKEKTLTIHDCLKMIGSKEITANIYTLPSTKKEHKGLSAN